MVEAVVQRSLLRKDKATLEQVDETVSLHIKFHSLEDATVACAHMMKLMRNGALMLRFFANDDVDVEGEPRGRGQERHGIRAPKPTGRPPGRFLRRKPHVFEAIQWMTHGDHPVVGRHPTVSEYGWLTSELTSEAVLPGDWIVKNVAGQYYKCDAKLFEEVFMPADDAN